MFAPSLHAEMPVIVGISLLAESVPSDNFIQIVSYHLLRLEFGTILSVIGFGGRIVLSMSGEI